MVGESLRYSPYRPERGVVFYKPTAWPFLVGGAICLVNSVNERDLSLLNSYVYLLIGGQLLRGTPCAKRGEA